MLHACCLKPSCDWGIPSKNCLARNMQLFQIFLLQDLKDLALNLAYILQVLYSDEAFLARYKNLQEKMQDNFLLKCYKKLSCKWSWKLSNRFVLALYTSYIGICISTAPQVYMKWSSSSVTKLVSTISLLLAVVKSFSNSLAD